MGTELRRLGYYNIDPWGELPSVTSILKVIDKPALLQWAARQAAKAVLLDPKAYDTPEKAAGAIYSLQESAKTRGTDAHEVAEKFSDAYIAGKADEFVSDNPYFPAIKAFFDTMHPTVLYREVTLVNTRHMYAGTADLIAKIGTKDFVVDYKCFEQDEMVLMADGTEKEARQVHHGDIIAAWDGDNVVPAKVLASGDNGIHDVFTISTLTGRQVSITEEHPVLTERGWVMVVYRRVIVV